MNKLKEMYAKAQAGAIDSNSNSNEEKEVVETVVAPIEVEPEKLPDTSDTKEAEEMANTSTTALNEELIRSIIDRFLFLKKSQSHLDAVKEFFKINGSEESIILHSLTSNADDLETFKILFSLRKLDGVERVFALMDLTDAQLNKLSTQLSNLTNGASPILDIQGKTQYLKEIEKMISSLDEDVLGQLKIIGEFLIL